MKTFMKWPILILMAVVTMCFFTACGGDDKDDEEKREKTEVGIHRITVEFSGDLTGLDADIWVTAVEGVNDYSDIFMDGVKVNEMPGAWSNGDESPKVQNYDLTSSADCNLMTATVSLYCRNLQNPVTVTLKGYVNGSQKNMKVIDCKPGEKSPQTFSFAADGLEFEY